MCVHRARGPGLLFIYIFLFKVPSGQEQCKNFKSHLFLFVMMETKRIRLGLKLWRNHLFPPFSVHCSALPWPPIWPCLCFRAVLRHLCDDCFAQGDIHRVLWGHEVVVAAHFHEGFVFSLLVIFLLAYTSANLVSMTVSSIYQSTALRRVWGVVLQCSQRQCCIWSSVQPASCSLISWTFPFGQQPAGAQQKGFKSTLSF